MEFSVLISVYMKESPIFLGEALDSILVNQSLKPTEVVLVKDGPLTAELDAVIQNFVEKFPEKIKLVTLNDNQGLGKALSIGLDKCKYDLVARMDSDDIADKNRFKTQIEFFNKNIDLDVLGGNIAEFQESPSEQLILRKVPPDSYGIIEMMKSRNPMNHVTIMFKKEAVIKAGGYKHLPYLEDYFLWIRMVEAGAKLANIDKTLVYVRTGENMYKRRGHKGYIPGWYILQKKMREMGIITPVEIIKNMISIICFIYMPVRLKEFVYKKFLRN